MQMIPNQPYDNKSSAERRVFDQLRGAFAGAKQNGWFAMHSLNLPQHDYKRFGETDFVVCGSEGLLVLEVKGGGVACRDGIWETRDRYGTVHRLKESPFWQAETAMHALCKSLPREIGDRIVVGYGVVAPDVEAFPPGAEWDSAVLADARQFRQFERWLGNLFKHWHGESLNRTGIDQRTLKTLRQVLRPNFEAARPLHVDVHALEERIARLTDDQYKLIDVVEANERVICSGGAGTGKTFLALELARRWAAAGQRVALACHSPWLKNFMERHAVTGVTACIADSIGVAARRAGVDRFDALIVDEGQDLLNMEALDRLDGSIRGGIAEGRWCFFHDTNNQSGLCGEYVPDAYDYLKSFSPVRVPLTTNCRNSSQILRRIKSALNADLGNEVAGDGPDVRQAVVAGRDQAAVALAHELKTLVKKDGFLPSDIVILSKYPYKQSSAALLPRSSQLEVVELDNFSPRSAASSSIGFAEIANFKGLESEVIVLVDLPVPDGSRETRSLHYVGMSRARALLSMICY